jgi:hypothetical protein
MPETHFSCLPHIDIFPNDLNLAPAVEIHPSQIP